LSVPTGHHSLTLAAALFLAIAAIGAGGGLAWWAHATFALGPGWRVSAAQGKTRGDASPTRNQKRQHGKRKEGERTSARRAAAATLGGR
jgi:hypothetical protein